MSANALDAVALRDAFRLVARRMKSHSEALRELDAACGDGDLGITVSKGFAAIERRLPELEHDPPARLLKSLGMTFNNAAASTFGVFFATGCMHAARSIESKETLSTRDLCSMLRSAAEGIATRGRAQVGDRTLLDALIPACEAAEIAVEEDAGMEKVLAAAAKAAQQGADATRDLEPKVGRSRWLGKKALGVKDPGATFVAFFLEACLEALGSRSEERDRSEDLH
jgi:dihydroxyacetone kinase